VTAPDTFDRTGKLVAVAVFFALVIDGMDLQVLSLSLPSISKELHLSGVSAGALSTYTLLGMGFGGVLAGWLSDRIGRVRVVRWSVLTFSSFTGVIALCQTYFQISSMRFISGFGIGALYSIGTLLAAEYVPTRMRTTVLGTLQAGWSVGYVIAALLSSWLLPPSVGDRCLPARSFPAFSLCCFSGKCPTRQVGQVYRAAPPAQAVSAPCGPTQPCGAPSCCGPSPQLRCSSATMAPTHGCPAIS
jgi:MFS family permease